MNAETSNARGEWVLVPREPTGAMIDAWRDAPNRWAEAYAAMLAAAPQPPIAPDYPITATCRVCDYDYRCVPVPAKCGACGTDLPPSAPVGVEGRYHPCTHILIDGLKRLEGGTAVLSEWDRARAQADAALAQRPVAVDVAAAKRAVAEVMSAPDGISVEAFFRIVLEAAVAGQRQEPTT